MAIETAELAAPATSDTQERVRLVLFALLIFAPYMVINRVTADWPARDMSTFIDHAIPFSATWELVYVSIYFYMFIPVVYLRDADLFRRAVIGFCVMQLICYGFFLTWPVGLERPHLENLHTQFLHWGVALNYVLDQPRNLFPSLHLANAFMVSLLLYRADRRVGLPALIWACLIGYSTLAVKHHLLTDVISGVFLALCIDRWLFAPVLKAPLPASGFYPLRNVFFLIAGYPAVVMALYGMWSLGWQPFQWPPASSPGL